MKSYSPIDLIMQMMVFQFPSPTYQVVFLVQIQMRKLSQWLKMH